jgi:hypothetical protein
MKYKKLIIETDGTSIGTKIIVDGKQIGLVQRLDFSADVHDMFVTINAQVARTKNGVVVKKNIKVKNNKTEKFDTKEEVICEPLLLERDA